MHTWPRQAAIKVILPHIAPMLASAASRRHLTLRDMAGTHSMLRRSGRIEEVCVQARSMTRFGSTRVKPCTAKEWWNELKQTHEQSTAEPRRQV